MPGTKTPHGLFIGLPWSPASLVACQARIWAQTWASTRRRTVQVQSIRQIKHRPEHGRACGALGLGVPAHSLSYPHPLALSQARVSGVTVSLMEIPASSETTKRAAEWPCWGRLLPSRSRQNYLAGGFLVILDLDSRRQCTVLGDMSHTQRVGCSGHITLSVPVLSPT